MRKIVPLFLAFTLIFSGVARASTAIDSAGAAALKKEIEDDLQWRTDMTKVAGQGIALDGKIEVTQKTDSYEVRLPHLSVLAGQQGRLDIGTVVLDIAPAPQAATWLIKQIALPPSLTFYDAKNTPVVHINVGSQRFAATWLPERGMTPKIDALFENVKITGADNSEPTVKIASVRSLINFKDNGDGTWSGPADFAAAGLDFAVPGQNPVTISIGKVSDRNVYDRLDMSQSLKMKGVVEKSLKEGALPQTDKDKQAFLAKILAQTPVSGADGLGTTFEVDKFFMHDTGLPEQPRREIGLDKLILAGLTTGIKQEKSKLLLKAALDGLHVSFLPADFSGIVPRKLNAEVIFDNLPLGKITDQLFTVVKLQAAAKEQAPDLQKKTDEEAKKQTAMLPKILQEAGTSLSVQDTYLVSDALNTSLQGKIDASIPSATGKITMVIKGLDEFVQKMQNMALKPGADPHMLGYLMGLMTLQTKGAQDKAADGTSIRNFALELKKDGTILLNGAVITPKAAPAAK